MRNGTILRGCGTVGIAGVLFVIAADVLRWFLAEGYSPVRQSISHLALGNASWLIDLGLWVLALACVASGEGMGALKVSAGWRLAGVATIAIAVEVAVVASINQYAGIENVGVNVHTWTIGLLYLSFAVAALASNAGFGQLRSSAAGYSRIAGWIWIVLAPVYYFWYPQGWAGLFARGARLDPARLAVVGRQAVARTARQGGPRSLMPPDGDHFRE